MAGLGEEAEGVGVAEDVVKDRHALGSLAMACNGAGYSELIGWEGGEEESHLSASGDKHGRMLADWKLAGIWLGRMEAKWPQSQPIP